MSASRARICAGGAGRWATDNVRGQDVSEAERCFVAYAAHELRGEIAVQLTLAEDSLGDPNQMWRPCARWARASSPAASGKNGCSRRCSPSPGASAGVRVGSPSTSLRLPPTSWEPTIITDSGAPRSSSRADSRRPTADRASRREPGRKRCPPQHPGRPARHRHEHAAGRATFRIWNTAPTFQRRAQPPVPAVQAPGRSRGPSADGVGTRPRDRGRIATAHEATVTARARTGGGAGSTWLSPLSTEGTEHHASPPSTHPHFCRRRCRRLAARCRLWRRLSGSALPSRRRGPERSPSPAACAPTGFKLARSEQQWRVR